MRKIATVLGTRPELTKLSPILGPLDLVFSQLIIHTGQHYSHNMDALFFEQLRIRPPDHALGVGSHSHGKQTGRLLESLERIYMDERPNAAIVLGDTNSALAGALAAAKLHIPVIHIEAGCRSFNRSMPEEVNRVIVDHISDLLLASDSISAENLRNEGIRDQSITLTGSTAIEVCLRNSVLGKSDVLDSLGLEPETYGVCTVHRAENTDDPEILSGILRALSHIAGLRRLVFPMHPRTKRLAEKTGVPIDRRVSVIEPQGYLEFLSLLRSSAFVLTDSGGVQEEAAALRVPCLILRGETEWQYLVNAGKNALVGNREKEIVEKTVAIISAERRLSEMRNAPFVYDTGAGKRIVDAITEFVQ
jgi:UDP-N-acetylglucosamine 2-epimerase (non-hydrolysing)